MLLNDTTDAKLQRSYRFEQTLSQMRVRNLNQQKQKHNNFATLIIIKQKQRAMKQQSQQQKLRKVCQKNQQRILNPQPFSRKRAYLNKQKCQQKVIAIEEDSKILDESVKIFDQQNEKFITQQIKRLGQNPKQFDAGKILKQLDQVNLLIGAIQCKNSSDAQSKNQGKQKIKTSYSTQAGSMQSPKSIDSQLIKIFKKPQQSKLRRESALRRPKSQQRQGQSPKSRVSEQKKMLKIKSNKLMLKVYNPFPTCMDDFI